MKGAHMVKSKKSTKSLHPTVYQGPRWVGLMKEKNAKKTRDTASLRSGSEQ